MSFLNNWHRTNLDRVRIAALPLNIRITMTPYAQLPIHKPEEFLRTVGLSQEDFLHLHGKLAAYLDEQKALNPLQDGGEKTPNWLWKTACC
jgi:hypothetical protein